MPKSRDIMGLEEENGVIIVKNGLGETKVYEIVGITKNKLYVGQDKNGVKECFSEYDLGRVEKKYVKEVRQSSGKYR